MSIQLFLFCFDNLLPISIYGLRTYLKLLTMKTTDQLLQVTGVFVLVGF